ncbi:MAG: glycosyltransferase [Gemmatimonadales bacterium]
MRFLLTPVGSSGDVHPFIGIGRELRARGHEVMLFSAEPHRAVVEGSGLEFVPTASSEQYHEATLNPDLWHPRRGFETVLQMIIPVLEDSWQAIESRYVAGGTTIVGHPLGFAARSFEDKTGVPSATLHLAPSSLRSSYQVPALPPGVDISPLPRWLKRGFWTLIDRAMIDPQIAPALNRWRATHGLPPVHRVFQQWINSPRMVVGMFPAWFGARQPDWPERFHQASFPLWDDPESAAADVELTAFLDRGTPPVVVSPGSANRHAAPFFAAAADALRRLGRRGLFLTGFPEQLPAELPDTVLFRRYAPFSAVLPRAAAMIHHGGIGTAAQCFAAGVPQLMMPMAFDQPDNALRATRLGAARWLSPAQFTVSRVTATLGAMLDSADVRRAAAACRDRLQGVSGIGMVCDRLEAGG